MWYTFVLGLEVVTPVEVTDTCFCTGQKYMMVVPGAPMAAPHRRDNVKLTDVEKARADRRSKAYAGSLPPLALHKVHTSAGTESSVGSPGRTHFTSPVTVKKGAHGAGASPQTDSRKNPGMSNPRSSRIKA